MHKYVLGRGPSPADVMIVGEAPGREEAKRGAPFVGPSGREQETYLRRHGINPRAIYYTNVVKEYIEGNPDPTPELISTWSAILNGEIDGVQPRVILAVGRFAARWFLGEDADMRTAHGIAHVGGEWSGLDDGQNALHRHCHYRPTTTMREDRRPVIVPVYHPAAGLYDAGMRVMIDYDYEHAARIISGEDRTFYSYKPEVVTKRDYRECRTDYDVASYIHEYNSAFHYIGFDTEGTPDNAPESLWSFQISVAPYTGATVRCSSPQFDDCVQFVQRMIEENAATVIMHNRMYDVRMGQLMGFEFLSRDIPIRDSMYAAYLLRTAPQGMKPLSYWMLRERHTSFQDTVRQNTGAAQQLDYLQRVAAHEFPAPAPREIRQPDGTVKVSRPQSVSSRARLILTDVEKGKVDKDGNPPDPFNRWQNVDAFLREQAESVHGRMPGMTLASMPNDKAVRYECRDADLTLQLHAPLSAELARHDLTELMNDGMDVADIFDEMHITGMRVDVDYFEKITRDLHKEYDTLRQQLIDEYNDGQPFNPKSAKQVRELLARRGLKSSMKTDSGDPSTSKKALEHLRDRDPAIDLVFRAREAMDTVTKFCTPILDAARDSHDNRVRCQILTTRTHTRRLATKKPNLLALPARRGPVIRRGFIPEPGNAMLAADFSQIEVRMAAHLSGDPLLCRLFHEGADIHSETAARIFGIPIPELDPMQHRAPAKSVCFGILYGIAGQGLQAQLRMLGLTEWSVADCDALIEEWLRVYAGVREFIRATKLEAARTGIVRDHWGMIRYLPSVWAIDRRVRAEAGRHAVSHKVQGIAQGLIQNSMRAMRPRVRTLQRAGYDVRWLLQVHDEVILECERDVVDVVRDTVMDCLENHHGLEGCRVPITASCSVGENWGELKG